ncbi:MAG TPA: ATP-binding protein [Actinoplanes sp.]|nr:ATP-binding protein [Actinoplanes sp.]
MQSEHADAAVVVADDPYWSGSVLESSLEAFISITGDGTVTAWNPAAEQTFGWSREQAKGAHLEELIIPERFRAAHREGLARLGAGEPGRVLGQRLNMRALHRDGHEFPIEMTLTVADTPAGRRFHALAHDVTASERASRFTAVEAAVSYGLTRAASSAEAAGQVVEALGVRMDWPVVELWLVDESRQLLTCPARFYAGAADLGAFAVDELEYGVGIPGAVCDSGRAIWVPDLGGDSELLRSREAAQLGLHVAVGVPIQSGGHVLGAIAVYGNAVEDPQDNLIALLGGVAAHVGQFLERRRAEELAIELARTKDEFVALVTHELRNPLAVICSAVDLLDQEADGLSADQQKHYLHVIGRSAERLTAMAGELLDLARLESGLAVSPESVDLSELLRQAVRVVEPLAAEKDLTLAVQVPDELELYVDPARIGQVADNLLSNAVKYTPAGGTVTVSAQRAPNGTEVSWQVADTGIGIPAAERSRLFRRFYRASTALDRRIPGTGLGLVIARTIVERHHGTITLAEQSEPGSTFVVRLPVK